jgi:hypothetical protein
MTHRVNQLPNLKLLDTREGCISRWPQTNQGSEYAGMSACRRAIESLIVTNFMIPAKSHPLTLRHHDLLVSNSSKI